MAIIGKQPSAALATPERFPTAKEWQQGLRWRRWRKSLPMLCGIVLVIVMLLIAALAPWFAPFSPSAQFSEYVLKAPGAGGKHILGTDEFGRDLLSRIIWGARVSLQVGLAAVVVGADGAGGEGRGGVEASPGVQHAPRGGQADELCEPPDSRGLQ